MQSSDFLSPGIALLKVIEGTVGEDFNSFAPTAGDYQLPSTVYPYSALTIILWIIFVIIMPILFTNLLVGKKQSIIIILLTRGVAIGFPCYRLVWQLVISRQFMTWQTLRSKRCRLIIII